MFQFGQVRGKLIAVRFGLRDFFRSKSGRSFFQRRLALGQCGYRFSPALQQIEWFELNQDIACIDLLTFAYPELADASANP
jgi:hypothetical protein